MRKKKKMHVAVDEVSIRRLKVNGLLKITIANTVEKR